MTMRKFSGVVLSGVIACGLTCTMPPSGQDPKGPPTPDGPIVQIPRLGIEVWENRAGVPPAVPHPFVWVWRVAEGSPAEKAGFQSGNTLERIGGDVVCSAADVDRILDRFHPGDAVPVVLDKQWTDAAATHTVTLLPGPEEMLGLGIADDEIQEGKRYVNHKVGLSFSSPSREWGLLHVGADLLWGAILPEVVCSFSSQDRQVWGMLRVWELSQTLETFDRTYEKWCTDYCSSQKGSWGKVSSLKQSDGLRLESADAYPGGNVHTLHVLGARGEMNYCLNTWVSEGLWNARKAEMDDIIRSVVYGNPDVHGVVSTVRDGLPAAAAGIQVGDGLLALQGEPLPRGSADFHRLIRTLSPGQSIRIDVDRKGERKRFDVVLVAPALPPLVYRNPPGWERAREVDNLFRINQEDSIFGWTPGSASWVKTVFMPGPEKPVAKIDRFHKTALDGTLIDPERYTGGPLLPGCQPLDPRAFLRSGRPAFPVKIGPSDVHALPDIVYIQVEAKTGSASRNVPPKRLFTVELHRSPPAAGSIPYQVLILGEFPAVFGTWGTWTWRDPKSIVLYEDGRLWSPEWKVERWHLVSLEFKERALTALEAFKLQPFEGIHAAEVNNVIVRWKNAQFDVLLREAGTADLRSDAGQIEQTILEASAASEREKDEAQRTIEKGQSSAEVHGERSRAWRARIEVLKPILAALKDEIANRGK
jgi:hypothetical protein